MKANHIPFLETGFFSPLVCDYLKDEEQLRPLSQWRSQF